MIYFISHLFSPLRGEPGYGLHPHPFTFGIIRRFQINFNGKHFAFNIDLILAGRYPFIRYTPGVL